MSKKYRPRGPYTIHIRTYMHTRTPLMTRQTPGGQGPIDGSAHKIVEVDHARLVAMAAFRAVVGEEEAVHMRMVEGGCLLLLGGHIYDVYTCTYTHTKQNRNHGPAVGHGRHLLDRGREEVGGGPVVHLRIFECVFACVGVYSSANECVEANGSRRRVSVESITNTQRAHTQTCMYTYQTNNYHVPAPPSPWPPRSSPRRSPRWPCPCPCKSFVWFVIWDGKTSEGGGGRAHADLFANISIGSEKRERPEHIWVHINR